MAEAASVLDRPPVEASPRPDLSVVPKETPQPEGSQIEPSQPEASQEMLNLPVERRNLPTKYEGAEEKMQVLNEQGNNLRIPFHLRKGEQRDSISFRADGDRIIMPEDVRAADAQGDWVLRQLGDVLWVKKGGALAHFSADVLKDGTIDLQLTPDLKLGVTHFDSQAGTVEVYKVEVKPATIPKVIDILTRSNFAKRLIPLLPLTFLHGSDRAQVPVNPIPEPAAIEQPAAVETSVAVEEVKRGRMVDYSQSRGPESFAGHVAHDLARTQSQEIRDIEGTNPDGSPINPLRSDDNRYQLVDRAFRAFLREQTGTDNRAVQDALMEGIVDRYHEYVVDSDNVLEGDVIRPGGVFWYSADMPRDVREIAAQAKTALAHEMADRAMQSAGTGNYGPTT